MNLKLFEVAGTHIFSMSAIVMVLFFVFAIIVVGYLLGKINIKGVSLGTAAIFLVALVVGHFKGRAGRLVRHDVYPRGYAERQIPSRNASVR